MRRLSSICVLIWMLALNVGAQPEIVEWDKYPYLKAVDNNLYAPARSGMNGFYRKLDRLLLQGDKQINIVHIGDSHIQADIFSAAVREYFQTFFPGGNGGRGFVFPYTMAHTNNPANYRVSYTGKWSSCRNVERNKDCLLGMAGIAVTTLDSTATFSLSVTDKSGLPYDFTRIRIFFSDTARNYNISLENIGSEKLPRSQTDSNVTEWKMLPASEITVRISRESSTASPFSLMGVALETDDPGIVYHAIGVNGADVTAFQKCSLLEEQLAELKPDLIIFSLGTNDAYTTSAAFDANAFENNYRELLQRVRRANPTVPILLTTPGDNYYRRKYANYNNIKAKDAIFNIARRDDYAVWDLWTAMGGLKSVQDWYSHGLTAGDKIHFSRAGYELQAAMLFQAMMESYENYNREADK